EKMKLHRRHTANTSVTGMASWRIKSLKRHLMTWHGMSPDEYRAKRKLPANYPLVVPNYTPPAQRLQSRWGLATSRKHRRPQENQHPARNKNVRRLRPAYVASLVS